MNKSLIVLVAAVCVTGCATKRYPIATPLSGAESELMTCEQLQLELIKAEQIENQIDETGEFDAKSVLGILGDFGIGNAMAKGEARAALSERKTTIRTAQARKGCLSDSTG